MDTFKTILILYFSCIIYQKSYGRQLYNHEPRNGSKHSSDESKLVKKRLNIYPQTSKNERLKTSNLLKINTDVSEEFRKKLPPSKKENYPSMLNSTDFETLEMQVGEHLVKVKSNKISESLNSAISDSGNNVSVNPKYSHIIEIIHRGDNLEKQNKPIQVHSTKTEKQTAELTKTSDFENTVESEQNENNFETNISLKEPVEFAETEKDTAESDGLIPEEFDEAQEIIREEFDEDELGEDEVVPEEFDEDELGEDEVVPEEFDEDELCEDEVVPEEFDEISQEEFEDEGDSEEFDEADERNTEESDYVEADLEEFDEANKPVYVEADLKEFEEADEGIAKDFEESGESDENVNDSKEAEDNLEKYVEGEEDSEEFEANEKEPSKFIPNSLDTKSDKQNDSIKKNQTDNQDNEQISNKEESAFNEEFEGSGEEFADVNELNTTKTGRLLGMFSRKNETFPVCTTPKGEAGHCRRLSECLLSEALSNFNGFLQQLCLIRGALVGICCPDNPVIEILNPDDENVTSELTAEEIKQPPEGCGLNTKTRIVGGTISVPHEWTWMVALMRRNRFYCGGVVINNWYILTAAHCVMGMNVKDLTVRLGEYDFNEKSKHIEDLSVSEIKRHAQFVTLTFQHDIALLKLKRSIKYSKFVGSICLPDQKARDYSDAKGTVVGWGTVSFGGAASPVLRQVTIPVWKNEDCDRTYLLERIGDSFMCAGSPEKGEDACQGDSGGPLMTLNESGRWEVIGLVSWGRRCGDPTYPGVYTRVTTYLDWIKQNAV